MLDTTTKLRRLNRVVEALCRVNVRHSDLPERIRVLQQRAEIALSERRLSFGNPLIEEAQRAAADAHKAKGRETRKRVMPFILKARREGAATFEQVAEALNKMGVKSPTGKKWGKTSVRNIERAK